MNITKTWKVSKYHAVWLIFLICLFPIHTDAMENGGVSAKAAVLIEQSSGQILFGKNETQRLPMASTTKIMTAIVALEHGNPEDIVTVSKEAAYTEGSSMYLHVGEEIRLESLLYGLMLNSGNDAAIAIAEHISGSADAFADLMNETAAKIGVKDTSFRNPNGLDAEGHFTTAYDLAMITRYGLSNPAFQEIVRTKTKAVELDGRAGGRILSNHNKMLKLYPGCDGVKTGFTKKCGRCLVSSATRDGMQLIAVTLNAPDDWNDHTYLLNYGFHTYKMLLMTVPDQEIEVQNGQSLLYVIPKEPAKLLIKKQEESLYCLEIQWNERLKAPIKENQSVGKAIVYKDNKVVEKILLIAQNKVEPLIPKTSYMEILRKFFCIVQ